MNAADGLILYLITMNDGCATGGYYSVCIGGWTDAWFTNGTMNWKSYIYLQIVHKNPNWPYLNQFSRFERM